MDIWLNLFWQFSQMITWRQYNTNVLHPVQIYGYLPLGLITNAINERISVLFVWHTRHFTCKITNISSPVSSFWYDIVHFHRGYGPLINWNHSFLKFTKIKRVSICQETILKNYRFISVFFIQVSKLQTKPFC